MYLMTKDKSIFIKNIFYMLSYAFQVLKQSNYEEVASEKFDQAQDLFAAILSRGVAQQLKQGLYREYITKNETLSAIRGKLVMSKMIRDRIQRKQKLACEFDELSENNPFNQILKTTIHYLVKDDGVRSDRKTALKKVLVFFDGIDLLEPSGVQWSRLHYQRNNKNYELLMNICYFVLDGMLQTTEKGEYKMASFSDEHMARLYERFILEYYRQHHTYLTEVKAAQIKWNLVGDTSGSMIRFLPVMQTDVFLRMEEKVLIIDAKYYGRTLQQHFDKYTLHSGNVYQIFVGDTSGSMIRFLPVMQTDVFLRMEEKVLIIDAKYYGRTLQQHFDKYTLHSGNVYQIFTYVKNQDKDNKGNIAGILLYAKTDEAITPDHMFNIGGDQIGAKTLDLNTDFKVISMQLDKIAFDFFGGNNEIELITAN